MSTTLSPERIELGRFFTVTARRFRDGDRRPMEMFSPAIDAEWHELLTSPEYADFCTETAGMPLGHAPFIGVGEISWVQAYEEMFGSLPEIWFTDKDGQVDREALNRYRDTGVVVAEWDCGPTTGDGDDAVPERRETATR
ncbi:hypothetical protein [Streptomyces sp. TRM49041]|uniref:hypothetical protein n=1 Tax=Streptomyces sp. TRM49041 TaxID=2603216 RepID=UPI0011EC8064|nr:hypothetical protein [Streptomyces sp. TRM49041]